MSFRKVPWKRNLAKIPSPVRQRIKDWDSDLVQIAVTKKIPLTDIETGLYKHVGITLADGRIEIGEPVLPSKRMGKWSVRNVEGWEKVRYDLPTIKKIRNWETPNFGDWSKGSHMTYSVRDQYQREFYQPPHWNISAELLNEPGGKVPTALIKFAVVGMLNRKRRADFARDLLWCLNILQENVGAADVYPSTATKADFVSTIALDWHVFPPGTREEEVLAEFTRSRAGAGRPSGKLAERVKLFGSLKPTNWLKGTGAFGSYVGAKFADDLVVFENVNYGNALYVLYDDWEDISKRSRLDLLKGTDARYDRFVHVDGWEARFRAHMDDEFYEREKRAA
jgi:hypothetical protein